MKKTKRCFQAGSLISTLLNDTGDAVVFFRDGRGDNIGVAAGLANAPHWASRLMEIAPAHKKEIDQIRRDLVAVKQSYKDEKLVQTRLEKVHKKLVTLKQNLESSCG